MKKKVNFSVQEKQIIKSILSLLLIQILIISFFTFVFIDSLPIGSDEIKQIDIVVDNVSFFKFLKSYWVIVYSDSSSYLFTNVFTDGDEYSVFGIEKELSKGDCLSLMYYEDMTVFGKMNMVVDAKNGDVIYRLFESFRVREKTAPFFSIFFLPVIEILFLLYAFFTISLNIKQIKKIWGKYRKKRTITTRGRFGGQDRGRF